MSWKTMIDPEKDVQFLYSKVRLSLSIQNTKNQMVQRQYPLDYVSSFWYVSYVLSNSWVLILQDLSSLKCIKIAWVMLSKLLRVQSLPNVFQICEQIESKGRQLFSKSLEAERNKAALLCCKNQRNYFFYSHCALLCCSHF